MAIADPLNKTSWADDIDEADAPRIEEYDEPNGVKVIVEYRTNASGKKVKITRRIRRTLTKSRVNHVVAERKAWVKFGAEKSKKAGPDLATTTIAENIQLKVSAGNVQANAQNEAEEDSMLKAKLGSKKILCRLCKGDHFTSKCPYRDTLEPLQGSLGADTPDADGTQTPVGGAASELTNPANPAVAAAGSGKYVPPSLRGGARGAGETMFGPGGARSRDEFPTLLVTNLTPEAEDDDLRDLFSRFGRVMRVYIGRDRETGACKGYAFVSFEDRHTADQARMKVNGMGYDNLILSCQWSQPRGERADRG